MKAFILKAFGDVSNLVEADLLIPEISDDEVLLKTKAISINPVDIKTRKGKGLAGKLKDYDPIILGWDISGIVIKTGREVTQFKTGDEVFGMINFPGHGKAYAEYVSASQTHLALKPPKISHSEASAGSLAALTAWQLLKDKVISGSKVLIHSAAGGVGHYAVQMAKYLGAEVTGTSSIKNKELVLSLGASGHIDYENQRFEEILHDFDFVLDSIGGDYTERSFKVLKPGGTIICLPSGASENITEEARIRGLRGDHFLVQSNGEDMKEISDLLDQGIIKSFISKTFSFDEIRDAHLQIETGKTRGKIAVVLD